MFGMNEKTGRGHFKNDPKDTLIVTSRFYTLQGEGPFRGHPAYFVRLTKCNLNCTFCDTFFDQGDQLTFDQILEQADKDIQGFYTQRDMPVPSWAKGKNRRIVLVITGGEPTLQLNLVAFLEQANEFFHASQIESNGILSMGLPEKTTYVVSPKCLEKNGQAVKYLTPNPETLERASCLKFVMGFDNDQFSPYSEVPDWAHRWAEETGKQVFVSPMNIYNTLPQKSKEIRSQKDDISIQERSTVDEIITFWEDGLLDMEANRINHEKTAEYAMKHGFILNLQIHLFASLP